MRSVFGTLVALALCASFAQAHDQETLIVTTDKPFYTLGERPRIMVVNPTPHTSYGYHFNILHPENVYDEDDSKESIPAGGHFILPWSPVWSELTAGRYVVTVHGFTPEEDEILRTSHTFEIVPKTTKRTVIRTTKGAYEYGEPVKFYVLTTYKRNRPQIPFPAPWVIDQETPAGWSTIFDAADWDFGFSFSLEGGDRQMWSWDQKDKQKNQVAAGRYSVLVELDLDGNHRNSEPKYRRSFRILPKN